MALFDDIVNGGNLWTGLAIGAGALIVWPLIGPVLRPITKGPSRDKRAIWAMRTW